MMIRGKDAMGLALETARLTIKQFDEKDAATAAYNSRQPRVAEEMSDMILTDEKAGLEWINWINHQYSVGIPWLVLSIKEKQMQKCIGLIGIIPQPKIQGELEILFSIEDGSQGQGYATEAAQKLIEWFLTAHPDKSLSAIVKRKNLASQKVVENVGFTFVEEREIVYDGTLTLFKYYTLSAEDE